MLYSLLLPPHVAIVGECIIGERIIPPPVLRREVGIVPLPHPLIDRRVEFLPPPVVDRQRAQIGVFPHRRHHPHPFPRGN